MPLVCFIKLKALCCVLPDAISSECEWRFQQTVCVRRVAHCPTVLGVWYVQFNVECLPNLDLCMLFLLSHFLWRFIETLMHWLCFTDCLNVTNYPVKNHFLVLAKWLLSMIHLSKSYQRSSFHIQRYNYWTIMQTLPLWYDCFSGLWLVQL
jgi:hypothetical protein